MVNREAVEAERAEAERVTAPYSASWVDRFTDWVDRLPIPSWVFYAGIWLVLYLVEIATQWTDTTLSTLRPFHIFFVGIIPLSIALIHYLDNIAEAALNKFRPVLNCSDAEYTNLHYQLTTLPARMTLVVGLTSVVLDLIFPSSDSLGAQLFVDTPASINFNTPISFIGSFCFGVLVYHTLHQLMVVSRIYQRAHVNVFNMGPLYVFSDLSARTAIGILALAYSWYATVPQYFSEQIGAVTGLLLLVITLLTFIWPLVGIHNLLVAEKERLLGECARRQEVAIAELYQRIGSGEMQDMDELNKALSSLDIVHSGLQRISSWPWQPETVRWFVAALLFPVIVWLMQWLLQRVLGP